MPRTQKKLEPGAARGGEIVDTLLLRFDDRRRQTGFVFGGKGTCVEFDFPSPPRLRTDDLLVLDDGGLAEVVADVEPLLELRVKDFAAAARLVWTLGNRHVPVQVLANRLRVQRRPDNEALLAGQGFAFAAVTAPFDPDDEGAAHGHEHHGHEHHGHEHHGQEHHGHDHDDHEHHGHAHGHDDDRDYSHRHGEQHDHKK